MKSNFTIKHYLQSPPLEYKFFSWSETISKALELYANFAMSKIEIYFMSEEINELVLTLNKKDC